MTHTFNQFSTNAMLTVSDLSIFKKLKKDSTLGLYTFIRAMEKAIPLRVDGVPILLGSNQFLNPDKLSAPIKKYQSL